MREEYEIKVREAMKLAQEFKLEANIQVLENWNYNGLLSDGVDVKFKFTPKPDDKQNPST
jgi:hypothetical protein